MLRKVLMSICCPSLLFISYVADSRPIDRNGQLDKSCTMADYFPLQVGNKWVYEIESKYHKQNMGFPTFYICRGQLSIEIINASSVNDSIISYQTSEHFIATEKRTFYIGNSSQLDTAIVYNQIKQNNIREQTRGFYSDGSKKINVDDSHFVNYYNGSFDVTIGYSTERYKAVSTKDTLKTGSSYSGYMILKNIGPIYYADYLGGQDSRNEIQVKLISAEIHSATNVISQKNENIVSFQLVQNYPNPFNATTTIEFYQQKAGRVSIKIFSLMGQEMAHLLDDNMAAGMHKITWDASTLSSGIYYYVLEAQGAKAVRKAILIK
jgi:hypothetical protein